MESLAFLFLFLLAFALAYITYATAVGDLGTGMALIYWPSRTDAAAQVTFVVSVATGWIWFGATALLAPPVAAFFENPAGAAVLVAIAWSLPIQALGSTHEALCRKSLRFRAWLVPELGLARLEARFDEAVEVMTRAWTTRERFSHKGRFWHFEDIIVEPPPAQRPHPPLWVAAGNLHSIRRAAARGFNLILDQYASAAALGERIAIYKAEREANGLPFDPMQVTAARQLYVAKDKADKDAALIRQAEYTRRTINVARMPDGKTGSHVLAYADKAGATEENALFGTPEEIAGMIEALRDAGVTYVLLTIAGGVDQLRRFAREIMPAFAREPAARAAE